MSGERITIRDIAAKAGVSKSTVAYALKGDPQCSEATRERIQKLAKEMGYVANPLVAVHLANVRRSVSKSGFAATLAYLSDRPFEEIQREDFVHRGAYEGARKRSNELGYALEVFCYEDPDMSWDRLQRILQSRGIQGIVFGPHRDFEVSLEMDWDEFSTVLIGDSIVYPKYHRVGFDHLGNMGQMFQEANLGRRRKVGLAMSPFIDRRVCYQFRSAFKLFQNERDSASSVPVFVPEHWEREFFLEWFEKFEPEVIVTVYDDVRRWLIESGRRVPEDVEILTPAIMSDSKDYSGVFLSLESLGRLAVDTVAAQLFRSERGVPSQRCVSLVVGERKRGVTFLSG